MRDEAITSPVTSTAPFRFKAAAQAYKVAPVVYTSSQRSATLIQWNDSSDFEHPRVHRIQCLRFSSPFIYQMVFLSYPISPNIIIYSHSKRISTFIVYGNPFMLSL